MRRIVLLATALIPPLLPAQESRPPTADEVREAIAQGAQLLVGMQENYIETAPAKTRFKNDEEKKAYEEKLEAEQAAKSKKIGPPREWPYEGVYRLEGLIAPGYRVGGTALVCWALMEVPGFEKDAARREAFDRGIAFILEALEKEPLLQSGFLGGYDVRGWGHTYGLRTLLRVRERRVLAGEAAKRSEVMIRTLIKTLVETEIPECGGWNYSRRSAKASCPPSTFMTAPTVQTLFEARKAGFEVPEATVERALKSLTDARLETGAFQYAMTDKKTGKGFEDIPGACARMAICETTLYLAGRGSIERIRGAVNAFFDGWEWLEKRRKQTGTHVPPYMIAPYYFHYAHTYVAQAIEQLPEPERPALRDKLRALYWRTREKDGGWNDRVFPRSEGYGTAMAILGLLMPDLPPPARWPSKAGSTATRPG